MHCLQVHLSFRDLMVVEVKVVLGVEVVEVLVLVEGRLLHRLEVLKVVKVVEVDRLEVV